jgi:hypothetical protein
MNENMVKCPHCFGEKPAAAKVCLHCGRDEQGYGPMIQRQTALEIEGPRPHRTVRGFHPKRQILMAAGITGLGFLVMTSSGLGSLLFLSGIIWLGIIKAGSWWREK